MANTSTNRAFLELMQGEINLDSGGDTIKIALLGSGYTPDPDDGAWADVSGEEIAAGGGYSAGGWTLAGQSLTQDDVNDVVYLDGNDIEELNSTITASYAVVYDDTHANDVVLAIIDFGGEKITVNATFTIQFSSNGVFRLAHP